MSRLRRVFDRLTIIDGDRMHPLTHLFLAQTFIIGVAFAFIGMGSGVEATVLYQLTQLHFGSFATSAWGLILVAVSVLNTAAVWFKNVRLARPVAMLGFTAWLYAAVLYGLSGFWFQLVVPAVVNMLFWAWVYITVGRFKHDK